ncbi:MAG: hypothetical protein BGO51_11440 [Rhodospirillales bacterium 69-11]|nr:MAG: hypothetical protein BGO51_11440 [Rhodospirillales bacterium 69-11]
MLFALLGASLAAAIFVVDTFSRFEIAIAVLYGIVILLSASLWRQRGLLAVAAGCAALTVLSFLIMHGIRMPGQPLLRCLVSLAGNGITTLLALRMQHAMDVLRAGERRYRRIFDSSGVAIWEEDYSGAAQILARLAREGVSDLEAHLLANPRIVTACMAATRTVDLNRAAVQMLQAPDKATLQTALEQTFLPETYAVQARLLSAFMSGAPGFEAATRVRTLRGEIRSVLIAATFPQGSQPDEHVFVSVLDVTERSRTEQALEQARAQLAHVNRVATMGELTASIAHEVNQPLAAVVTQGEAALRWLRRPRPDLEEVGTSLEAIVRQGRRAGEVVRRLRAMSRDVTPQRAVLDVNEVVNEAVLLLRRELSEHEVELALDLFPASLPVAADRIQLQQVLMNLMMNGAQAMEGRTTRALQVRSSRPGPDLVEIAVQDRGRGLDEDQMARLFTAFYTTREHGMGMGLSISRSIVESHGGRIRAERNADGPGATFAFTLPLAAP